MIIDSFSGEFEFLSNFSAHPILWHGEEWPTVEHAFQGEKMHYDEEREAIRSTDTPAKAKRMGRRFTCRPDWDQVKRDVMRELVRLKFAQHPDLGRKLIDTGSVELVEGNQWHDNTWGDCSCDRCQDIPGENWLGRILMEVRAELRSSGGRNEKNLG